VLGKGWVIHLEGQNVMADMDSFQAKLIMQEICDDLARKVRQVHRPCGDQDSGEAQGPARHHQERHRIFSR